MRFLLKRMEIAEIVDPSLQTNHDRVFFGATVIFADQEDRKRTVRIVGIDETRPEEGEISWVSPVARALLNAELGDVVTLQAPGGDLELEVMGISYAHCSHIGGDLKFYDCNTLELHHVRKTA